MLLINVFLVLVELCFLHMMISGLFYVYLQIIWQFTLGKIVWQFTLSFAVEYHPISTYFIYFRLNAAGFDIL